MNKSSNITIIGKEISDEERDQYERTLISVNHRAEILDNKLQEATIKLLENIKNVDPEQLCPKPFMTSKK